MLSNQEEHFGETFTKDAKQHDLLSDALGHDDEPKHEE